MTTPTIQEALQGNPSLPLTSEQQIGTNLVLPNVTSDSRLAHFPEAGYDIRHTSHLSRFMKAMLGDTGTGGLRKRYLMSRLQTSLHGSHFLDLDRFYGALFGFTRLTGEAYSTNPYTEGKTADEWEEIHTKDASYRSRIAKFARAINMGATPDGMEAAAEAVLSVDCEVIETFYLLSDYAPIEKKNSALAVRNNFVVNPIGNPTNRLLRWGTPATVPTFESSPSVVNIARGKGVTGNFTPAAGTFSLVTDGQFFNTDAYVGTNEPTTPTERWVKVDLGEVRVLKRLKIWHFWALGRTYNGWVDVSVDNVNWTRVRTGHAAEKSDGSGNIIDLVPVNARYIRDTMTGSNVDFGTHWNEIQAFEAIPERTLGTTNLCLNKSVTYNGILHPTLHRNPTVVTDGLVGSGGSDQALSIHNNGGETWIQVDLGTAQVLGSVKVYRFSGDTRFYNNDRVAISADGTTWHEASSAWIAGTNLGNYTTLGKTHTFPPRSARYIRVYASGSQVDLYDNVYEIQAYGAILARDANPYSVVAANPQVMRDIKVPVEYMLRMNHTADGDTFLWIDYAAAPGETWTASTFIYQEGTAKGRVKIEFIRFTGSTDPTGGDRLVRLSSPETGDTFKWVHRSATGTAPAGTEAVRLTWSCQSQPVGVRGYINFTAPMLEKASEPGNYFDGSIGTLSDNSIARWTGVAYDSISTLSPPAYRTYASVESTYVTYSAMEGALSPATTVKQTYSRIQTTLLTYSNMQSQTYGQLENTVTQATPGPALTYTDIEGVPQEAYNIGRVHNTANPGEFIVRPKREITPEEHYEVTRVLSRLKPAEALMTISPAGVALHNPITIFNAVADSEHWEIDKVTKPISGGDFDPRKAYTYTTYELDRTYEQLPDYTKDTLVPANRPPFSGKQGDDWSNNGNIERVICYDSNGPMPAQKEISDTWGVPSTYLPSDAIMPIQRLLEARAMQDGVLTASPFLGDRQGAGVNEASIEGDREAVTGA